MLAQPLPDGRVAVLLSAHDERLISQDARAILDYLDRVGADHDPTAEVASTLLRLRRGGAGRAGTAPSRGRRIAPSWWPGCPHWPVTRSIRWSLVHRKVLRHASRSCFPGRATNGGRWEQTPTSDCPRIAPRPTVARRRSSRPGCRRHCRTCRADGSRFGRGP